MKYCTSHFLNKNRKVACASKFKNKMSNKSLIETITENVLNKYVAISLASIIAVTGLKIYARRKDETKRREYSKDVVILHQFPPSTHIPRYIMYRNGFSNTLSGTRFFVSPS